MASKKQANHTMTLPGNLKLLVEDEVAQGMYSNLQVVGSNETEFVLDFAYVQPQQPVGKVRARIVLSPKHAKALMGLLSQRMRDYEERFGEIAPLRRSVAGGDAGGGLPN